MSTVPNAKVLSEAISALHVVLAAATESKEAATLKEVTVRLGRLQAQYDELMALNERLMATDPLRPEITFDPATDTLITRLGDQVLRLELNRPDPAVPREVKVATQVGAYMPGATPDELEEIKAMKLRMETLLEDFYYSAHRILKLAMGMSKGKNIKAKGITIVRNHLIEHPNPGALYTFGWSTGGPVVKPMHRGDQEWHDSGLVANTMEFANALARCFN